MSLHDCETFIMWHRNIVRPTLKAITNSRPVRLAHLISHDHSRLAILTLSELSIYYILSLLVSLFRPFSFITLLLCKNLILETSRSYFRDLVRRFNSRHFYLLDILRKQSHFTDSNQSSSSPRSGSITPICYADLDRRVEYGHRLRFAIIVDGVIDAHLSRCVADNRRTT